MSDRPGITILALFALGIAVVTVCYLILDQGTEEGELAGGREEAAVSADDGLVDQGEREPAISSPNDSKPSGDDSPPGEPEKQAIEPAALFLSGRVIDLKTGAPVDPFHLTVEKGGEQDKQFGIGSSADLLFNESISDEEGRFTVPLEEPGLFDLTVFSPGHRPKSVPGVSVERGADPVDLEIRLDPDISIPGRVVDDATGEPVSWALIGIPGLLGTNLDVVYSASAAMVKHAWSDDEGNFVLGGLEEGPQKIVAVHDDYAEGWADVAPGEKGPVEIRLKKGPRIFGRALDDEGEPCAGVTINLQGDEMPVKRSVETDIDGKYRTFPVNPGRVDMRAFKTGRPGGKFSREWKSVVVADRDVEVDFGLAHEFVTWSGTLYGMEGGIQAGTDIIINRIPSQAEKSHFKGMNRRYAPTDDEGRFRFRKLHCGGYDVSFYFPDRTSKRDELTVHLDTPGEVVKDISLAPRDLAACGTVRGVLVDGATGLPIKGGGNRFEGGPFGYVKLGTWSPSFKSYTAYTDENGRFELEAVPAGTYDISARATDYPPKTVRRFVVKAGEVIDDMRIVMSGGGELRVRLQGFLPSDPRDFKIYSENDKGKGWYNGQQSLASDGTWDHTFTRDEGIWTVTVIFMEMGLAVRECRVMPGRAAEVLFKRDDFLSSEESVTVAGEITRRDGTPGAGIEISFFAKEVTGPGSGEEHLAVATDEDGAFSLDGFRAGRWSVTARLGGGANLEFPDMDIPSGCENPHPLHLVMEIGSVSGTLVNGLTGKELDSQAPPWSVLVRDIDHNRTVCRYRGGRRGGRFEIAGVPECRFIVTVSAREFFEYTTAAFEHAGAGNVDGGRIVLQPSGVLDLFVADQDGGKVESVQLFIDGKEIPFYRRRKGPEGSLRYDRINPGPAAVAVGAPGYRTQETELNFKAGVPVRLEVTLEKR